MFLRIDTEISSEGQIPGALQFSSTCGLGIAQFSGRISLDLFFHCFILGSGPNKVNSLLRETDGLTINIGPFLFPETAG